MDFKNAVVERLGALPIYQYEFINSADLVFEPRVRQICSGECPMYGKSWSCPPGTGTLEQCRERCLQYKEVMLISTVAEVSDIANMDETLSTRREHEDITRQVKDIFKDLGVEAFVLSSEACQNCEECAYPNGPCKYPDRMLPCIESHCILVTDLAERFGIEFLHSATVVTWFSLIFFDEPRKGTDNEYEQLHQRI